MKKMMRDYKGWIWISNLVIIFPIIIGVIMWNKLPDRMPLHFSVNGQADSFCDKWFGVFIMPLIPLALHWLIILMCATDKKIKAGTPVGRKTFVAILFFVPIIAVYSALLEYSYSLDYKINSGRMALAVLGIVYVILGNFVPKIKQNNTVGVRLPWIMNNPNKWSKTNRFGGWMMFIFGVIMLIGSFVCQLTGTISISIIIGGNVVLFSIIIIYSLIIKDEKSN